MFIGRYTLFSICASVFLGIMGPSQRLSLVWDAARPQLLPLRMHQSPVTDPRVDGRDQMLAGCHSIHVDTQAGGEERQ